MRYDELAEFIENGMRMSHIYQPVMLIELLKNQGQLSDEAIARKLLSHDISQIEYYKKITNNMVGKVLAKHGIVERDRATKDFRLIGFESLDTNQVNDLVSRCQKRLEGFCEVRGDAIYQHRNQSKGYISGTLRYEILKRAKFRCELCGISGDQKGLEVDHIVPRSQGGSDDLSNLQTLCYSCNAMKRDRDDTDFRDVREIYSFRKNDCIFCQPENEKIFEQNELAYAMMDGYPVSKGHVLVIPKRHTPDYFDLGQPELNACTLLLDRQRESILNRDSTVTGFNIGVNIGEDAGQTVLHCHIHLIPRRRGDTDAPAGGVRKVIDGAGDYSTNNS